MAATFVKHMHLISSSESFRLNRLRSALIKFEVFKLLSADMAATWSMESLESQLVQLDYCFSWFCSVANMQKPQKSFATHWVTSQLTGHIGQIHSIIQLYLWTMLLSIDDAQHRTEQTCEEWEDRWSCLQSMTDNCLSRVVSTLDRNFAYMSCIYIWPCLTLISYLSLVIDWLAAEQHADHLGTIFWAILRMLRSLDRKYMVTESGWTITIIYTQRQHTQVRLDKLVKS